MRHVHALFFLRRLMPGTRPPRDPPPILLSCDENRTTTEPYRHSIGGSERHAIEVLDGNFSENSHNFPTKTGKGLQT
jgi:hypothetical protein